MVSPQKSPRLAVLLLAGLCAGCASKSELEREPRSYSMTDLIAPTPAFLTGPAALLLTNATGFSAHVTADLGMGEVVEGELLGRGPKLFFARQPAAKPDKEEAATGLSYIWDVSEGRGYVLSEVMQGYAPLGPQATATNLIVTPAATRREVVQGQPCVPSQVTVQMDDGSAAAFEVWRAQRLRGIPVRVLAISNAAPARLTLSQIRLAPPSIALFEPPAAFTRYANLSAMVAELRMRQFNEQYPGIIPFTRSRGGLGDPGTVRER